MVSGEGTQDKVLVAEMDVVVITNFPRLITSKIKMPRDLN